MKRTALVLALFWIAVPATAQEPCPPCPPPPPAPPLWTGSVGFSYLATSGNSDAETIGLTAGFARQPTPFGLELQALANRAETEGDTTAERYLAGLRGKRALSERYQLFAGAWYERDEFAGFDSRLMIESGAVWRALTGPVHELDFDAGLTWTDEEPVLGPGFDSVGAVAGLTYVWKISATAAFRQRLVVYPSFEDSDDWRLRSETTLEAALATSWALRAGFLFARDHAPAAGFEQDDSATSVSLVWKR